MTRFVPFRLAAVCLLLGSVARGEPREIPTGGFASTIEVVLPGAPETIYDAISGDIGGWWDHTFSGKPARFFIEARPGGGFYEYFDAEGKNGVLHATVIYAERGKLLRFRGPLGLSGNALDLVVTYGLEPSGPDSTRLAVTVDAAGHMEPGWPEVVDGVWKHFILDRFKPYVEAGKHLGR